MKKFIVSMIAVFGAIAIALILLMTYVIGTGGTRTSFMNANATLVHTSSYNMDGITNLTLEYSMDDIILYESDTNELKLMEYMSIVPEERELTQVKQTSSGLSLRGGDRIRQSWLFYHYSGYVEVYLPSAYTGRLSASTSSGNIRSDLTLHLSDYNASCSSGDIYFNEVFAKNIDASTSSGNIRFDKAEGSRSFSSSSGDIRILGGDGDSDLSSTSGNITIQGNTGKLSAHASSGDITIKDSSGNKDIETTSGNITVDFTDDASLLNENISANASSGDVTFRLPSGLSFEFNAETSSGEINTYFDNSLNFQKDGDYADGTVGNNPVHRIEISTTSGNITVKD